MSSTVRTLTVIAIVGCGAMGGVFFAFSGFVMAGLKRLPPDQGVAAMQSINVTAVRPPLMIGLFGTALVCLVLGVVAVMTWGDRRAALLLAGSLCYLLGCIALTAIYHVPHNDALAALDPAAPGTAGEWSSYLSSWTAWNHVRAVAGLAAAALFALALTA